MVIALPTRHGFPLEQDELEAVRVSLSVPKIDRTGDTITLRGIDDEDIGRAILAKVAIPGDDSLDISTDLLSVYMEFKEL